MGEMFPMMLEIPDKRPRAAAIFYWIVAFVVLPFVAVLMFNDIRDRHSWVVWIELGYHACNFAFAVFCFWSYLKESLSIVRYDVKGFVKPVLIGVALILGIKVLTLVAALFGGQYETADILLASLPTGELDLFYVFADLIYLSPVYGTLYLVLLAPVTTCCLYYACGFAPVSYERPKLAYLVIAGVLLVPRLALAFSFWTLSDQLILWLVQLPVHLVACWTYQKTDNVWAPIAVHSLTNLVVSLLIIWLFGVA